jgi:hypothetical protein
MTKRRRTQAEIIAAFRGLSRRRNDPSDDQNPERIAAYYQAAKPGDRAVIRQTQGGELRFSVDEIENVKPEIGRLYLKTGALDWGGRAFYRKSGKSCYAPMGQTSLVIPTEKVLRWIEEHPSRLR